MSGFSGMYTVEASFVMIVILMVLFGVISGGLTMYKTVDNYAAVCGSELEDRFWACDTMRVERIVEGPVKKVTGDWYE